MSCITIFTRKLACKTCISMRQGGIRRQARGEHTPLVNMWAHYLDGEMLRCLVASQLIYIIRPSQTGLRGNAKLTVSCLVLVYSLIRSCNRLLRSCQKHCRFLVKLVKGLYLSRLAFMRVEVFFDYFSLFVLLSCGCISYIVKSRLHNP